jgi:hypothetical protein
LDAWTEHWTGFCSGEGSQKTADFSWGRDNLKVTHGVFLEGGEG